MTWTIDKQFDFCYGHRVWSQKLNASMCAAGDAQAKCRHLHGHEGLIHVFLESDHLDGGMVTDFKHLGWLKDFINTYLDHKFIIDISDPLFMSLVVSQFDTLCGELKKFPEHVNYKTPYEFVLNHTTAIYVPGTVERVAQRVNLSWFGELKDTPEYEQLEGYTIVNFLPTSENLAAWMFFLDRSKMRELLDGRARVTRVDWYETPKSRSSFSTQFPVGVPSEFSVL